MKWTLGVILLAGLAACGRPDTLPASSTSSASSPMVACSIELPPHALRDQLLGDWEMEGEFVYRIRVGPNDSVVIERITNEREAAAWRHEIKNPRWQDGKLLFDKYAYAIEMPSHPFSGQRVESYIAPTSDPDVLLNGTVSVEFDDALPPDLAEPMEMHRASPP